MKKLILVKAAIDFAYANYALDPVSLAEKSIAAFKAASGAPEDLGVWNQVVLQNVQQATQFARQRLPSEVLAAQKSASEAEPAAPASNATAATIAPPKAP